MELLLWTQLLNLKMKQKTIFDILNDICFNKVAWKDQLEMDKKMVQPYMLNRWFSMSKEHLDLIAELQPLTDLLSTEHYYEFYRDLLPKKKFFVKYVKSQVEKDEKQTKLIQFLSQRLQLSEREVKEIIEFSSKQDLEEYIRGCGFNDKQLKSEFGLK